MKDIIHQVVCIYWHTWQAESLAVTQQAIKWKNNSSLSVTQHKGIWSLQAETTVVEFDAYYLDQLGNILLQITFTISEYMELSYNTRLIFIEDINKLSQIL